jgi:hypothetical protein
MQGQLMEQEFISLFRLEGETLTALKSQSSLCLIQNLTTSQWIGAMWGSDNFT